MFCSPHLSKNKYLWTPTTRGKTQVLGPKNYGLQPIKIRKREFTWYMFMPSNKSVKSFWQKYIPASSKACCLKPKKKVKNRHPKHHPFSTPWKDPGFLCPENILGMITSSTTQSEPRIFSRSHKYRCSPHGSIHALRPTEVDNFQ